MRRKRSRWVAAGLLFSVALAAWTGVVLFSFSIQGLAEKATVESNSADAVTQKAVLALKIRALARDIGPQRMQLESLLQNDPLALAGLITKAGRDAGVQIRVSDAIPDGSTASSKKTDSNVLSGPSAITFTAQADAPFSKLLGAVALLEALPAPSSIQTLEFVRPPVDPRVSNETWRMNIRIRILTSSQVSS